jgi:iron complex outermembrane recepter protein
MNIQSLKHHADLITAGILAVTVLMSSAALGQATTTQTENSGPEVAEIVVTAQRREESSQKVPITVNAFSGQELQRLTIVDQQGLQFSTPGLTFPQDQGTISPFIRGRGTIYSGPGLEGSVAIYVDDAYLESQWGSGGLLDISQVEVLKGPQGTLYGRNATGGAIVIQTADPTPDYGGHISVGYGNFDAFREEAVFNLPVGDTLAFRIATGIERHGGFLTNTEYGGKEGARDRSEFRIKALWDPTSNFSVLLKVDYQDQNFEYERSQLVDGTGKPTNLGFYDTFQTPLFQLIKGGGNRLNVWNELARVTYKADSFTVTNTTSYRVTRFESCNDNDNIYANLEVFCTFIEPGDPEIPHGTGGGSYDETFTDELRGSTNFAGPLNLTAGVYYQDTNARFPAILEGELFGPLKPFFDNYSKLSAYSGFAEGYYEILPGLKLTAGGRYSIDDKSLRVVNNADVALAFGIPPALVPVTFRQNARYSNFTPRAVLAYDMGNQNYYASYSKGFKSGGFTTPTELPQTPLRPEITEGYEIGAKLKFLENRMRLNSAVFFMRTKDVQVASVDEATGSVVQQNAAGAHASGFETELQVAATEQLTFQISGAYLHSRYTSYPNASVYANASVYGGSNGFLASAQENLTGSPTPNSPDFTGSANATYAVKLSSDWSASVTIAESYTAAYDFDAGAGGPLGIDRQHAFGLTNLSGELTKRRLTLSWYISNAFQKQYYDNIQTGAGLGGPGGGTYGVPALPRTYGGAIRYNF